MASEKSAGRQYLSALVLFVAITVTFTFPAVLNISTHFIGRQWGDKFQFIWNFWWVRYAMVDLGRLPFYCPIQYYPTGVSLALHDMVYFWSFLSIPLQYVLDRPTILNLSLLLCFPINAMAFYHMAREVAGSHRGAVIGSLLFAFCPYLMGRFHTCHIQYLSVFTMPLFLLELNRYCRSGRQRHMACAGLHFILTALISYYYAAALSLILVCVAAHRALAARKDPARLKRLARHMAVFIVLTSVVLSPFIGPAVVQLARGDYRLAVEPVNNSVGNSGDLISYVIPDTSVSSWVGWEFYAPAAKWARSVNAALNGNILEKSVYPGWTGLLALLAAALWRPLRRAYWPWVLLAVSFFILSLGPTLHVRGDTYLEGMLPFRILNAMPLFGIMRSPSRLSVFITLGAGVVVAGGCARIKGTCRPGVYRWITLAMTVFVLIEFLQVQTCLTPKDYYRSPYYRRLADEPGGFSIINIPVDFTGAAGGGDVYLYLQSLHHKPIIGGYVSREPEYVLKTLNDFPFLQAGVRRADGSFGVLTSADRWPAEMHRAIAALSVGRIILQRALLTREEQLVMAKRLAAHLGPPVFEDRWIIVFDTTRQGSER